MKSLGSDSALKPLYVALRARRRRAQSAPAPIAVSPRVRRLALWAGGSSSALALAAIAAQAAVRGDLLAAPWNGIVLAAPQLLLVPVFLILILCLDHVVTPENRTLGNLAVAFALLYAVLVPMVSVLLAVSLSDAEGQRAVLSDGSFVRVLDGLGRVYMCVSVMFAGLAFDRSGLQRMLRWLGAANGVVALAILAGCVGLANPVAHLWAISLPAFALLTVPFFRQMQAQPARPGL